MRFAKLIQTVGCVLLLSPGLTAAPAAERVTIVYDAFGKAPNLGRDWGFSALIQYGGKQILFDTGNNADIFARNVDAFGVDLKRLDFAVISHRHGDHTTGLNYLLRVNPALRIYTPRDAYGVFGGSLPGTFYRRAESLPPEMRYYGGEPPDMIQFGTPWKGANFVFIDSPAEIAPGVSVIPTVSEVPGTLELHELSLSIQTPRGQVLVVGCSHAGIEKVLEAAGGADKHVHLIVGGLHLVTTPDPEIRRIANALQERWRVDRIAPGHCTGEPAFAILKKSFAESYLVAGLGTVIDLP